MIQRLPAAAELRTRELADYINNFNWLVFVDAN
jgi:hypothetical protein